MSSAPMNADQDVLFGLCRKPGYFGIKELAWHAGYSEGYLYELTNGGDRRVPHTIFRTALRLADEVYNRDRRLYWEIVSPVVALFAGGSNLLFPIREPEHTADPKKLCEQTAQILGDTGRIIDQLSKILADGQVDQADRQHIEGLQVNARVLTGYLHDLGHSLAAQAAVTGARQP